MSVTETSGVMGTVDAQGNPRIHYPVTQLGLVDGLPDSLATEEESAAASRAYAVGEFLIYKNQLYRAVEAIPQDGEITPGVNVTATKLADYVAALGTSLPNKADLVNGKVPEAQLPDTGGNGPSPGDVWYIIATQKWTVPLTGYYKITCFGGGGGGQSGSYNGSRLAGSGGAAGYMAQKTITLTKGDSHTVTIGLGGASDSAGAATSFDTLLTANGGAIGSGGSANGGLQNISGEDNSAYGYLTGYGGQHGQNSYDSGSPGIYYAGGGGGAGGFKGNGGEGGHGGALYNKLNVASGNGGNGTGFASGGGGGGCAINTFGSFNGYGGCGAPGICIIEFLGTDYQEEETE